MRNFIGAVIFLCLLLSCSDNLNPDVEEGNYAGIFTVKSSSISESGRVEIRLNNSRYECSRNPDKIPAGGSGKYKFENNMIIFEDENMWTADFDWNLILAGEYFYSFTGNNLKIWKHTKNGYYEYILNHK